MDEQFPVDARELVPFCSTSYIMSITGMDLGRLWVSIKSQAADITDQDGLATEDASLRSWPYEKEGEWGEGVSGHVL